MKNKKEKVQEFLNELCIEIHIFKTDVLPFTKPFVKEPIEISEISKRVKDLITKLEDIVKKYDKKPRML